MTATDRLLLDAFWPLLTEARRQTLERCLALRTRHLTIVLEDIYQPQNSSAVLRSCDCFGIQDVHIIENSHAYDINPKVLRGANKWLHLHRYHEEEHNTERCLNGLRQQGYVLAVASPHEGSIPLGELPIDRPVAVIFGAEKDGLSPVAQSMADVRVTIPMQGFSESLNISVSAAICAYSLSQRIRQSLVEWELTQDEQDALRLEWAKKSVRNPEAVERSILAGTWKGMEG